MTSPQRKQEISMKKPVTSDPRRIASKQEANRELTIDELKEVTGGLIAFPRPVPHLPTTTGPTYPR
jgi:bacteriocin-like protein